MASLGQKWLLLQASDRKPWPRFLPIIPKSRNPSPHDWLFGAKIRQISGGYTTVQFHELRDDIVLHGVLRQRGVALYVLDALAEENPGERAAFKAVHAAC